MKRIDIIRLGGVIWISLLTIHNAIAQPARPKAIKSAVKSASTKTESAPAGEMFVTNTVPIVQNGKTVAFTNVVTKVKPLPPDEYENPSFDDHFALNTGFILLNPYSLTTNGIDGADRNRRKLQESSGTDAKFFIDVGLNYVWAWDADRRATLWNRGTRTSSNRAGGTDGKKQFALTHWDEEAHNVYRWLGWDSIDVQAHISFYAKDDKETTAAAMVGSGNFGSELTVGLPILQSIFTRPAAGQTANNLKPEELYNITRSVHWIGLVGSYSAVTDSGAFDIHDRILGGLGYRAAFRSFKNRDIVWNISAGIAAVDTVRFVGDDTKEIVLHHEDVPSYRHKTAFALESEAYIPVTDSLSAVVGTRLYSGLEPNTWNAYIGLTVPFDRLIKGITTIGSDADDSR